MLFVIRSTPCALVQFCDTDIYELVRYFWLIQNLENKNTISVVNTKQITIRYVYIERYRQDICKYTFIWTKEKRKTLDATSNLQTNGRFF